MNEDNEVFEKDIETGEEVSQDVQTDIPDSMETGADDNTSENTDLDASGSLYDKLVEDIADKLKEDSPLESPGEEEGTELVQEEITEPVPDNTTVILEEIRNDISSNNIGILIDYLKEQEFDTSVGMAFSDAHIYDLTVTDGLLLIILVMFLFKWLYEFGKGLFL